MTPVEPRAGAGAAARVADFAQSEMFRRLFREGMELVEETASYLDGSGREDSKRLGRAGALAYAALSMTLTTKLMQCASWLLTQRAVAEGDMAPDDAAQERYRLSPPAKGDPDWPHNDDPCPPRLDDLAARAGALHDRLIRLDASLFEEIETVQDNPVADQLSRIHDAFRS